MGSEGAIELLGIPRMLVAWERTAGTLVKGTAKVKREILKGLEGHT